MHKIKLQIKPKPKTCGECIFCRTHTVEFKPDSEPPVFSKGLIRPWKETYCKITSYKIRRKEDLLHSCPARSRRWQRKKLQKDMKQ
jgi:hypothetical protein